MVTGELKSKIDSLWEIFWTGGLTNPLDVIEQMTYLMFIRDLDDADNLHAKEAAMLGLPYQSVFAKEVQIGERTIDGSQLKWSVFHDFPAAKMYSTMQEWVFPFIKNLHGNKESAYSKYMSDAIFKIPTPLMLDKIVTAMDAIYEQMSQLKEADTRGDVYEYLLSKLATAGVNGQFRTPRHIIKMMVDMMEPKADDIICDPACGTSGFLVAASEYLKDNEFEEEILDVFKYIMKNSRRVQAKALFDYNVFLIGFMGAGKTTIASELERKLEMHRIEMDEMIVKKQGMSISEIFDEYGEIYFRNLESNCLIELQKVKQGIISCGGGVILRADNADHMKKNGRIVLLTATPETILERVKDSDERPILNNHMNVEFISDLLNQRKDKYLAVADVVVATDGKSTDQICDEIIAKLIAFDRDKEAKEK